METPGVAFLVEAAHAEAKLATVFAGAAAAGPPDWPLNSGSSDFQTGGCVLFWGRETRVGWF